MKNNNGVGLQIGERKFREILKYFCEEEIATETSEYVNVNRNTVKRIYQLLREPIAEMSLNNLPDFRNI